jgi:hypothetical protein
MKYPEVEALLAIISGLDRRPFPEGAAATWYRVLAETDFDDAKGAVLEYFGTSADEVPTLLPGRVRSGASRIKHWRLATERKALVAAPVKLTEDEAAKSAAKRADAQAAIRAATAAAVANVRRRDPNLRPYKHRTGTLISVA